MSVCPRVRRDFRRLREAKGWSAIRAFLDVLLFDSGFQALALYRMGHTLRRWGVPFVPPALRRLSIALCGIDILPGASIGGGCILAHGLGLVIGGRSVVGEDCTFLQGVTLGEARFEEDACPCLGNRITVGAGATILGGIKVGDDAMIGAGAVVIEDVPAGATVAGVPARVIKSPTNAT